MIDKVAKETNNTINLNKYQSKNKLIWVKRVGSYWGNLKDLIWKFCKKFSALKHYLSDLKHKFQGSLHLYDHLIRS